MTYEIVICHGSCFLVIRGPMDEIPIQCCKVQNYFDNIPSTFGDGTASAKERCLIQAAGRGAFYTHSTKNLRFTIILHRQDFKIFWSKRQGEINLLCVLYIACRNMDITVEKKRKMIKSMSNCVIFPKKYWILITNLLIDKTKYCKISPSMIQW